MGILANFKIRTKVLFALAPLAVMVIVAALYSSIQMHRIDSWYGALIRKDVKALHNLTIARVLNNRFGQLLYEEIAEQDLDKMQVLDGDLNNTTAEFHDTVDEAKRDSPDLAPKIDAATAMFDKLVADSRPIRSATMAQDNVKAMKLASGVFKPEMLRGRQALVVLADDLHAQVDREAEELTAKTRRTILITWIVIALGLAASFSIALSIVQVEVVKVVMSFRGRILDVAEGRLDQPVANLDRPNEIGEMSRALQTLQLVSRERHMQSWVKEKVSAIAEELQSSKSLAEFGKSLFSRLSESIPLLYGGFYVADES